MLQREPPVAVAKALVLVVWGVVPLSWAYVLFYVFVRALSSANTHELLRHIVQGTLPAAVERHPPLALLVRSRGCFAYAALEVLFSLYYRYLKWRVQSPKVVSKATRPYIVRAITDTVQDGMNEHDHDSDEIMKPNPNENEMPTPTRKLDYDDPRAITFRREMLGWFIRLLPGQVTKHDLREWMSWALFGEYYEDLLEEDAAQVRKDGANATESRRLDFVDDAVRLFAARSGLDDFPQYVKLEPSQERAKWTMLLSLDPVRVSVRPLAMYIVVRALNELARFIWRKRYGMELLQYGSVQYLLYMPPGWRAEAAAKGEMPLPVLFLHGLGLGMIEYAQVVWTLCARPRPVLIPLQPWTSYDLFSERFLRPWHMRESAELVRGMLKRHGLYECGVSVLSHSMGTILHSWLLKEMPGPIRRSFFVDPVCFQMWAPHLCYRFLYKRAHSFIEYMLRYFVAREVGTANVLTRNFEWSENSLFLECLPHRTDPNRTRVYLAGWDTVVDAPALLRFLRRHGMGPVVEYAERAHHGAFVMGPHQCLPRIVRDLDAPLK